MRQVEGTTKAGEITYPLTHLEFETFDEFSERAGGEQGMLNTGNARQKQGATQGLKGSVREAIEKANDAGWQDPDVQAAVDADDAGGDEALDLVLKAIHAHQENAAEYVMGAARRSSGLTKTAARKIGEELAAELGDEEMFDLAVLKFGEERARELFGRAVVSNGDEEGEQ